MERNGACGTDPMPYAITHAFIAAIHRLSSGAYITSAVGFVRGTVQNEVALHMPGEVRQAVMCVTARALHSSSQLLPNPPVPSQTPQYIHCFPPTTHALRCAVHRHTDIANTARAILRIVRLGIAVRDGWALCTEAVLVVDQAVVSNLALDAVKATGTVSLGAAKYGHSLTRHSRRVRHC